MPFLAGIGGDPAKGASPAGGASGHNVAEAHQLSRSGANEGRITAWAAGWGSGRESWQKKSFGKREKPAYALRESQVTEVRARAGLWKGGDGMEGRAIGVAWMVLALLTGLQNPLAALLDEEDAASGRYRRRSSDGGIPCGWYSRTHRCRGPPAVPDTA